MQAKANDNYLCQGGNVFVLFC